MAKSSLFYYCVHCKKMVQQPTGPHWLDEGAILFCPKCGKGSEVHFTAESSESIARRESKQDENVVT